jgi:hypothetical protein
MDFLVVPSVSEPLMACTPPASGAVAVALPRVLASSFRRIAETWCSTVRRERTAARPRVSHVVRDAARPAHEP